MDLRIDKTPMTRGVTSLMVVGDDAVENAVASGKPGTGELAAGAVAVLVALQSRGVTRLVSAGIVAWVGYRALKAK